MQALIQGYCSKVSATFRHSSNLCPFVRWLECHGVSRLPEAARTNATMPARTATGSIGQAATTAPSSGVI